MILYKHNNDIFNYCIIVYYQTNLNYVRGVQQGSIIISYLFAFYMDILVYKLHNTNEGCIVGRTLINCFLFADVVVLMAPKM